MARTELQQLEDSIRHAQSIVDLGDALERLKSNRDFKRVILDAYFEKEAIRLVHLKADVNLQSPASQESILRQIDAISTFAGFLRDLSTRADMAQRSKEADEATRDELLQEGA